MLLLPLEGNGAMTAFVLGLKLSQSVLKMEHKVSSKIFLPSVKGIF